MSAPSMTGRTIAEMGLGFEEADKVLIARMLGHKLAVPDRLEIRYERLGLLARLLLEAPDGGDHGAVRPRGRGLPGRSAGR